MRNLLVFMIVCLLIAFVSSCPKPTPEDASTSMPVAKPQPIDKEEPATPVVNPGNEPVTPNKDPLPADFGDYNEINIKINPPVNAYDFEATDVSGKTVKLVDYRGSWVYIDFWATWCGPCIDELPNVAKLPSEFPELKLIGISLDGAGDDAKIKEVMTKNKIECPQIIDAAQKDSVAQKYGVNPIPFSVLINPEGKIVMKAVRGKEMFDKIKEAIGA